jgi:hypothetical protein
MIYQWDFNQSNTTGVTSGALIAYPSGEHEFTPVSVVFMLLNR